VKKEIFNQIGPFDTNLKVNADYLFILQLFDKFQGRSLDRLIAIYKGGGESYGYKLTASEKIYLKKELNKLFNPIGIAFLTIASAFLRIIVYLKNIHKTS
jgi:hypothetical protein